MLPLFFIVSPYYSLANQHICRIISICILLFWFFSLSLFPYQLKSVYSGMKNALKRASYGSFSLKRNIFYAIIYQIGTSPQTNIEIFFSVVIQSSRKRKLTVVSVMWNVKCTENESDFLPPVFSRQRNLSEWVTRFMSKYKRNELKNLYRSFRFCLFHSQRGFAPFEFDGWLSDHKTVHPTNYLFKKK